MRTLLSQSQTEKGPLGPFRRSFLPTFQGAPQPVIKYDVGLSKSEREKLSPEELKRIQPMQVQVAGTKETLSLIHI